VEKTPEQPLAAIVEPALNSKIQQLLSSAQLALSLGNNDEVLKLYDEALNLPKLETSERIKLLMLRALAHYFSGSLQNAVADWTQAIEWPGAPIDQVADALYNRGATFGQ